MASAAADCDTSFPALDSSAVVRKHAAAALVDPHAIPLEAPAFSLDARGSRPLLVQPGAGDRPAGTAERVCEPATLAGNAIAGGWPRTSLLLHGKKAAAALIDPDAAIFEPPTAPLHACGARALLDQVRTRDPALGRAEPMLEILARARDLASRSRAAAGWPEIELGRASLRHPDAVAVVTPRPILDARRARLLDDEPNARDALAGRAVVPLKVAAFAGDARRGRRERCCHERQKRERHHRFQPH